MEVAESDRGAPYFSRLSRSEVNSARIILSRVPPYRRASLLRQDRDFDVCHRARDRHRSKSCMLCAITFSPKWREKRNECVIIVRYAVVPCVISCIDIYIYCTVIVCYFDNILNELSITTGRVPRVALKFRAA